VAIDSKAKRYSGGQRVAVGQHFLGPTLLKDIEARKNKKLQLGLKCCHSTHDIVGLTHTVRYNRLEHSVLQ
jgi:hypothetical protein